MDLINSDWPLMGKDWPSETESMWLKNSLGVNAMYKNEYLRNLILFGGKVFPYIEKTNILKMWTVIISGWYDHKWAFNFSLFALFLFSMRDMYTFVKYGKCYGIIQIILNMKYLEIKRKIKNIGWDFLYLVLNPLLRNWSTFWI